MCVLRRSPKVVLSPRAQVYLSMSASACLTVSLRLKISSAVRTLGSFSMVIEVDHSHWLIVVYLQVVS